MDNYRKPPRVNRYWKRPKPKVYDCNVRDAERFYQESYKTYLSDKEDAASRSSRARSLDPNLPIQIEFYPHLVAGNTRRETAARTAIDLPSSLSDSTRARLQAELSSNSSQPKSSFTARASGLPAYEPVKDVATIDERLERLKKLREELGLPSEPQAQGAGASLSFRSESMGRSATGAGAGAGASGLSSDLDLYKSERTTRARVERTPEESTNYSLRSERSARVNGTAGPADDYKFKSDVTTNDYKFRSERNADDVGGSSSYSKFKSERNTDDLGGSSSYNKYKSDLQPNDYKVGGGRSLELSSRSERAQHNLSSPKLERKRDDYSFSSSTAADKTDRFSAVSSSAGTAASSRKIEKNLDVEVDDDKLASMMKKMPSSQEILERISKMELDD